MITLEQFNKAIGALKETDCKNSEFSKAMEKVSSSWFISDLAYPANEMIVELLAIFFDDKDEWIDWWVYENEYGAGNKEATDEYGNPIHLRTVKELYNFLISNMKDKQL